MLLLFGFLVIQYLDQVNKYLYGSNTILEKMKDPLKEINKNLRFINSRTSDFGFSNDIGEKIKHKLDNEFDIK